MNMDNINSDNISHPIHDNSTNKTIHNNDTQTTKLNNQELLQLLEECQHHETVQNAVHSLLNCKCPDTIHLNCDTRIKHWACIQKGIYSPQHHTFSPHHTFHHTFLYKQYTYVIILFFSLLLISIVLLYFYKKNYFYDMQHSIYKDISINVSQANIVTISKYAYHIEQLISPFTWNTLHPIYNTKTNNNMLPLLLFIQQHNIHENSSLIFNNIYYIKPNLGFSLLTQTHIINNTSTYQLYFIHNLPQLSRI